MIAELLKDGTARIWGAVGAVGAGRALSRAQLDAFRRYYELLMDYNARVNLTAITGERDVAEKHFLDSLLPLALIPQGASVIDVGTGAGFPGVPIKLMRPDIGLTLLDSLNKRVAFLTELCRELGIEADCVHMRAEDAGRDASAALRGAFDVAVTRAVGSVAMLTEYTVPLVKVGGASLMYKGGIEEARAELSAASNALRLLKADAELLPCPQAYWGERCIVRAVKREATPKAYPRKAGTAKRSPL